MDMNDEIITELIPLTPGAMATGKQHFAEVRETSPFETLTNFSQHTADFKTFKSDLPKKRCEPSHIDLDSPNYDNVFDNNDSGFNTGTKIVAPKPRRINSNGTIQAPVDVNQDFCKQQRVEHEEAAYYGGRLSDKLSDYEDVWNSSPSKINGNESPLKFIITNKAAISDSDIKLQGNRGSAISENRLSIINPGYISDSDSERSSPCVNNNNTPDQFIDVTKAESKHVNRKQVTKQVSVPLKAEVVTTQVPIQRQNQRAKFTLHRHSAFVPVTKGNTAAHGESHVIKPGTSPGYREPVDSLIGRVHGVSNTSGAVRVRDSIKQNMAKRCSDGALIGASQNNHITSSDSNITSNMSNLEIFKNKINELQSNLETIQSPRLTVKHTQVDNRCRSLEPPQHRIENIKNYKCNVEGKRSLSLECLSEGKQSPTTCLIQSNVRKPSPPDQVKLEPVQFINVLNNNHGAHYTDNANKHIQLSQSFQSNFFTPGKMPERTETPLRRFPVYQSQQSVMSNCSEASTVEDIISSLTPELKVHPIKPLTIQNLQRMSEYDNLGHHAMASHKTASSVGTYYCRPWDNSAWQGLLQSKTAQHVTSKKTQGNVTLQSGSYENTSDVDSDADYSLVKTGHERTPSRKQTNLATELATSFEWKIRSPEEETSSWPEEEAVDDDVVAMVTEHIDESDNDEDQQTTRELLGDKLMPFLGKLRKIFY